MKIKGCIRCGAAGAYVIHPLELVACDDCYLAWIRDKSCSVDAVETAVGKFHVSNQPYSEHMERYTAELTRRTHAWAKRATAPTERAP